MSPVCFQLESGLVKLLEGWGCDSGQTGGEVGSQNPHDPE